MKNALLGALGGAGLASGLAAIVMASARETGTYAFMAGLFCAPRGLGLGAVAGALASRRSPFAAGLVCCGIGLGLGFLGFVAMVSMVAGNWVMGLLGMVAASVGGFTVGFVIARWRSPGGTPSAP